MIAVVQRVKRAAVRVAGTTAGEIGYGILLYLGVESGDTREQGDMLARKILQARIFSDDNGKMNRCITECGGSILVISQFTLCADVTKGNRPSFNGAADPEVAQQLYGHMLQQFGAKVPTAAGIFGAKMEVESVNDGPVTFLYTVKNRE